MDQKFDQKLIDLSSLVSDLFIQNPTEEKARQIGLEILREKNSRGSMTYAGEIIATLTDTIKDVIQTIPEHVNESMEKNKLQATEKEKQDGIQLLRLHCQRWIEAFQSAQKWR